MIVSNVDLSDRLSLNIRFVLRIFGMSVRKGLSIQVASVFLVVVTWKNLRKSVLHFHFSIKSSCHESVWAKCSNFLLEFGNWRLNVVVAVVGKGRLPFFLDFPNIWGSD